jgi:hypothetical protein
MGKVVGAVEELSNIVLFRHGKNMEKMKSPPLCHHFSLMVHARSDRFIWSTFEKVDGRENSKPQTVLS